MLAALFANREERPSITEEGQKALVQVRLSRQSGEHSESGDSACSRWQHVRDALQLADSSPPRPAGIGRSLSLLKRKLATARGLATADDGEAQAQLHSRASWSRRVWARTIDAALLRRSSASSIGSARSLGEPRSSSAASRSSLARRSSRASLLGSATLVPLAVVKLRRRSQKSREAAAAAAAAAAEATGAVGPSAGAPSAAGLVGSSGRFSTPRQMSRRLGTSPQCAASVAAATTCMLMAGTKDDVSNSRA